MTVSLWFKQRPEYPTHHLLHDNRYQGREEVSDVDAELLAGVACTTSKNSPKNVPSTNAIRNSTVAQGHGKRSDVISDNSVGGVDPICIFSTKFALVWSDLRQLLDLVEERGENIGVVVGSNVLQNRNQSLVT